MKPVPPRIRSRSGRGDSRSASLIPSTMRGAGELSPTTPNTPAAVLRTSRREVATKRLPKRLVACDHARPVRKRDFTSTRTTERANTDDINLRTSTNTIRPRPTSVRRVDSPDLGLPPIDPGWYRDGCQVTAIDLSQRRSTESKDGHHAEGETRQREHGAGAPPVYQTAGDEVADAHHPARRPPVQCHHPTADVIGYGDLEQRRRERDEHRLGQTDRRRREQRTGPGHGIGEGHQRQATEDARREE